jgi:hypothetical protein
VFLASRNLAPFAASLCRLVGGSLGKGESGLYPLTGVGQCRAEVYSGKASVVFLRQSEENEPFLEQAASELRNRDIQLFAEARARQEISQLNLMECMVSFFEYRKRVEYFGLYVYLDQDETVQPVFQQLRESLSLALGLPVLLAWGPRSLDSYGYMLRVGAPGGLQMLITGDSQGDVAILGTNYSFGQLYRSLALGQFEALSAAPGLALRLHLASVSVGSLAQLQNLIQQALRRTAP